ncbi:hypothetical protein DFP72DRAFT_1076654 [Ephemerocybe angulata]|uniref:DUF262 domain-containing protein n=1 Tax=Ephemerocybe angulata TaxID=980116 RepID=A0A8H6HGT1_9AGAR|nr:hypothetical protein DFP72DRAFT_1076654 [Tulosesus angulatus]
MEDTLHPQLSHRTVRQLIGWLESQSLLLARSPCVLGDQQAWPESKQLSYIRSVPGFIPLIAPLVFQLSFDASNGLYERNIIDGLQRIRAINRFVKGEIPYVDGSSQQWYIQAHDGSHRALVTEQWKTRFLNTALYVCDYEGLSPAQINSLRQHAEKYMA